MSDALLDAPPVEAEQDDSEAWLVAWAMLLLLLNANANRPLTMTQRARARKLLRVAFEDGSLRWAQRVTAGQVDAAAWRVGVEDMIGDYARQMAVAGAGTMPDAATQQFVRQQVAEQRPFLDGFAAAVAAGALSIAALAARTKLYGASGWASHWQAQASSAPTYAVEQWIARDDKGTCSPCAALNGRYFLPGEGAMPGSVCRGAGNCRCERRQVIDRAIWQRLTGRRA